MRQERIQLRPDQRFLDTVDLIRSGHFGWEDYFQPLVSSILGTDYYLLANDFPSYVDTQVIFQLGLVSRAMPSRPAAPNLDA